MSGVELMGREKEVEVVVNEAIIRKAFNILGILDADSIGLRICNT